MKNRRHDAILEIIAEVPVVTQEQLIELLAKRGIKTTQATLSRDIQQLSLIKARDEKNVSRYMPAANQAAEKSIFSEAVLAVDYAMNTIVLKCRAGMAQGTCAAIDSVNHPGIVGTIAGDDTIFILVRSEADAKRLSRKFRSELFPKRI
ncbi:MAG: ArgR family transcriptional regulator [Oscillospiraceae bacterium]|nr:ArgR family transcriptional regulator [Oscillospiraceae bacterium]